MKREILCPDCGFNVGNSLPEIFEDGSTIKKVYGVSVGNFVCDACLEGLGQGDQICCVSYLRKDERPVSWEPVKKTAGVRE